MNKKAIVAIAVMAVAVLAMSCTFKVNKTVTHSKTTKTYTGSAVKPFDRIIIDAFSMSSSLRRVTLCEVL